MIGCGLMGCGRSSVASAGETIEVQVPSEPSKPAEPTAAAPVPHKPAHLANSSAEAEAAAAPPQFAEAEPATANTPAASEPPPSNDAAAKSGALSNTESRASDVPPVDAAASTGPLSNVEPRSSDVPLAGAAATSGLNEESVLEARGSSEKSLDSGADDAADDLGWVSATIAAASTNDEPPAWAVSAASGTETIPVSDMTETKVKVDLDVKVQIFMDGGWRDSSPEETLQICQHMARRERKFQIKARGQLYDIDLDGGDGVAWQTNTKSGKRRKMRIMDSEPVATTTDPGIGRSASASSVGGSCASSELAQQLEWGSQSMRGGASRHPLRVLEAHPHGKECFLEFERNERKMCGEWAVFYHSYSFAALLYEVQAAVGAVLFRFRSQFATLPRILVHEFNTMFPKGPDGKILMDLFNSKFATCKRDHHPEFRAVGLSVMCSLWATGPEACPPMVFISGYSCKDLSFRGVLENVLESCYVPKAKVKKLAKDIIDVSEEHGLDVSQFGGKPCKSGMAGHLLQIFMKRDLVDKLTYPAKPYGPPDEERLPLSSFINANKSMQVGQARIIAHPKYFMQASQVRCYVASADQTFHRNRVAFQERLTSLLDVILGEPALRLKAATGIYGGKLPAWWSDEDQRSKTGVKRLESSPLPG